jgi:hypothetical protein
MAGMAPHPHLTGVKMVGPSGMSVSSAVHNDADFFHWWRQAEQQMHNVELPAEHLSSVYVKALKMAKLLELQPPVHVIHYGSASQLHVGYKSVFTNPVPLNLIFPAWMSPG